MGFHLVARVYDCVKNTSPTAQAVLAYLAFRADDKGKALCYPSLGRIMAETHFGRTAIRNALNELSEAKLLRWIPGGRQKGNGGRSLANEYMLMLPSNLPQAGNVKAKHPSLATVGVEMSSARCAEIRNDVREKIDIKRRESVSIIAEAMRVAGVSDDQNRRVFISTILPREKEKCLEVIYCFESECRAHEHTKLKNPAACLNRLLSEVPKVAD